METQELQENLEKVISNLPDFVSPYRLGKIEGNVRGRNVPTQKIYGYLKNGYIRASKNELGKYQIERSEAERHLTKTIAKEIARIEQDS